MIYVVPMVNFKSTQVLFLRYETKNNWGWTIILDTIRYFIHFFQHDLL